MEGQLVVKQITIIYVKCELLSFWPESRTTRVAVYYQYWWQVVKHHKKLLMQPWLIPSPTFP